MSDKPDPNTVALAAATEAVIDAALRQLAMMGKGRDPSPRLAEAIETAHAAIAKATGA